MSINLDRSFFMVICEMSQSIYSPEMELEGYGFNQMVEDISDGQFPGILAVVEHNPGEGWSNDITADVMAAAFPEEDDDGEDWSDYSAERVTGAVAGVEGRRVAA